MVRRMFSSVRQYDSHRQLIASVRSAAGRPGGAGLDAIIVPASRHASNLDHAVTLARAAGCMLVVFCSRRTRVVDVEKLLAERCFSQAVVVRLPESYRHSLLQFESSELARTALAKLFINPNGDLSSKRNLGLLLARMTGWSRIFFMDDDVRDITSDDLAATVSQLARYRSVGMRVTDVPDNSVVCHAHRETGADQDVFVSGSVLAVGPHEKIGFFPEIYNEDWFFFHDDAQSRRLGWSGRDATQLYYDPFGNVQRAARQEFGDVLAEGLYTLLHLGEEKAATNLDFWEAFLAERRKFLQNILDRSKSAKPEIRGKMTDAVRMAMRSLKQVEPWMCEEYIQAWGRDLKSWQDSLASLPTGLSVDSALSRVGLSSAKTRSPARQPPVTQAGARRNGAAGPASIPRVPTAIQLYAGSDGGNRDGNRVSRAFAQVSMPTFAQAGIQAFAQVGMQFFGGWIQREPEETDTGKGALRVDTSSATQPVPLAPLDIRPVPCDPGLEVLRTIGESAADLANAGGPMIAKGEISKDQTALARTRRRWRPPDFVSGSGGTASPSANYWPSTGSSRRHAAYAAGAAVGGSAAVLAAPRSWWLPGPETSRTTDGGASVDHQSPAGMPRSVSRCQSGSRAACGSR